MTFWTLATEDELSEAIGKRLLAELLLAHTPQLLRKQGFGYLRSKMNSWRQLARHQAVVILTDLDRGPCPLALLQDWLGGEPPPPNLSLRIAVREVESWVLADHHGMRELIGPKGTLPISPDELPDPKQELLRLAELAKRDVRRDLVEVNGAILRQGLGYNARLAGWVASVWSPVRAAERSPSLQRTRLRLKELAERLAGG